MNPMLTKLLYVPFTAAMPCTRRAVNDNCKCNLLIFSALCFASFAYLSKSMSALLCDGIAIDTRVCCDCCQAI